MVEPFSTNSFLMHRGQNLGQMWADFQVLYLFCLKDHAMFLHLIINVLEP